MAISIGLLICKNIHAYATCKEAEWKAGQMPAVYDGMAVFMNEMMVLGSMVVW